MQTTHKVMFTDARHMVEIPDESVELVVTSPPYPMIEMWDKSFAAQAPEVTEALREQDGNRAFGIMHAVLDEVWSEVYRVLRPGSLACINVGDATRTVGDEFRLYPNHARILNYCLQVGFSNLPAVIWRKQTNAPNKFMGSGMLPAGAYVTLEHEFILILRKGGARSFKTTAEKAKRRDSAFFWEERNAWFSDVWWDLKGIGQNLNDDATRKRSGAFPFELPYRLIMMYSGKGDTVLDPFLGTGTTALAAMAAARNSIGIEIEPDLREVIFSLLTKGSVELCNGRIRERLENHLSFVAARSETKGQGAFKHRNGPYGFPVVTRQEVDLVFNFLRSCKEDATDRVVADYVEKPVMECPAEDSLFASLLD